MLLLSRPAPRPVVLTLLAGGAMLALAACSSAPHPPPHRDEGSVAGVASASTPASAPVVAVAAAPPPRRLVAIDPPGPGHGPPATAARVAARIFAFSDSQLHYLLGKRTFAQSPFAERMSFEVAVRPAALDDGSDLLLDLFMDEYRYHYGEHSLVFLGDAADLSCLPEIDAFFAVLSAAGVDHLLGVTSNHDGFYAGNFTSKRDVDGNLRLTDMPHDWTRACSAPGRFEDRRLTKGRAVARFEDHLPPGPKWATAASRAGDGPTDYRDAYLYYARPLGGGDPGAPPVWGLFLDTVDYRGFDFESSQGAGSTGAVSSEQLRFLDRAMLEIRIAAGATPVTFVAFGHHPLATLEPDSRMRLARFLDGRPEIVGYVTAHEHYSTERTLTLPSGRALPELLVGSTTDAPQAARTVTVYVDSGGHPAGLSTERLVLDAAALCGGVTPLPPDALGYTGYRLLRDGTPDLDIDTLDKLAFALGLDDLAAQRIVQGLGAMMMENELVRAWARLYADAPVTLAPERRDELAAILARRYAAGKDVAALTPYLRGQAKRAKPSRYNGWHDPAMAKVLGVAELGVHRFGAHADTVEALRARRTESEAARTYFLCHAVHAAAAEAKTQRREGNVVYIR
ncbi:hypothetical protein [Haliangium sp.]|uniref:hypothetical protein n=1 Tax=Haliangium sp. TaxID=2663208 RepID=UPI003D0EEB9B